MTITTIIILITLYLLHKAIKSHCKTKLITVDSADVMNSISTEVRNTTTGYNIHSIESGKVWTDTYGNQYVDYTIHLNDNEAEALAERFEDTFGSSLKRIKVVHNAESSIYKPTINNIYIDKMECHGDMKNIHSQVNIKTNIENPKKV